MQIQYNRSYLSLKSNSGGINFKKVKVEKLSTSFKVSKEFDILTPDEEMSWCMKTLSPSCTPINRTSLLFDCIKAARNRKHKYLTSHRANPDKAWQIARCWQLYFRAFTFTGWRYLFREDIGKMGDASWFILKCWTPCTIPKSKHCHHLWATEKLLLPFS